MASNATPKRAKRARQEPENNESPLATSIKRRRLNVAAPPSPSTPNALDAVSSAISGALGKAHRSSARRVVNALGAGLKKPAIAAAGSVEVPDSEDDDQPGTPSGRKKVAGSAKLPAQSAKVVSSSIYDFPDSDEEMSSTAGGASLEVTRTKETKAPLRKNSVAAKLLSSSSKAARSKLQAEDTSDTMDESVVRRRPGVKSRQVPVASSNTPKLRGILTPSKRGEKRAPKSVAFDGEVKENRGRTEEVHFDDLPGKSIQSASQTNGRGAASLGQSIKTGNKPEVKAQVVGAKDDADNDDDTVTDEEVCVICSLPHSEPPNEILFCDNCDKGYHQDCYNVPVIPKGDWLCRDCSDESSGTTTTTQATQTNGSKEAISITAKRYPVPDIANFEEHICAIQRLLLDRCTGKRQIKLRGQEEAYDKALRLVEQTVVAGEGNSMLVIGARGCGKTALIDNVISEIAAEHKDDFHVVRLNGFIHTDDKIALKEIWRQLGKEMEVEDGLINKTNNYADTLASLLAVLSHPSEIAGADSGVTSKSVVFVMDEFDLFATHARQTLLYNLFDIAQARKAPIAVIGLTSKVDVVETLEKRVKSRFSHRYVYLSLPKTLGAYWDICKQGLLVEPDEVMLAGLSGPSAGRKAFNDWWNKQIETLREEPGFRDHLEFHYYSSKSVTAFYNSCIIPLSQISASQPWLTMPSAAEAGLALEAPESKLVLLESLSDLDLALLIAAARLDIVAHTDTVNFAMAYDEYTSLMGRQRVMSATSGVLALGGGARTWGRGVAGTAWEHLISVGLLTPASGAGRASTGNMGLEAKMWKVDVALEEIPIALKPSSILARWCREI
ncbi:uncharacterized protein PgNI_04011 [Pyricularia grisea]|uniref:PHD-type domain-containing protein n=1 Tax=Pyricularia grisea TaxID=148305 RepID=A0A6P8B8N8_PYRGI|nr:uncharacterized protein PgNI_04011 [Pyricularia grisea]TLD12017.1 hypothetical protein PgNI_04011 [Pyricularia grisea]